MAYNADDIQKLGFPVSVQKRPGMYMGEKAKDKNTPGMLNVLVREIMDNSFTEVLKGYGDHVTITFHADGSVSCLDNGRGLPTDTNKTTGKNGIIMTMAELHSGGNFSNKEGANGPGLNGVGGAAVNALSERFDVEVYRNNHRYHLSFKDGYPGHFDEEGNFTEGDKIIRDNDFPHERGTLIHFKPDMQFFSSEENIIIDDIIDRIRYTVYLIPNLVVDVIDETRTPEEGGGTYHFENKDGIEGMVDFISTGDPLFTGKNSEYEKKGIYHIQASGSYKEKVVNVDSGKSVVVEETRRIPIDVAFRFNADEKEDIRSFANTIQTHQGGVHERALTRALMDTFGKMVKKS